jgi:glutaredoxin
MLRPAFAGIAVALAALLLATAAGAQIYRWTDATGKVYYGDKPPPNTKASEVATRISSYAGAPTLSGAPPGIAVGRDIVLYSTDWCGYCKQARAHLDSRRIRYSGRDVEKSDSARNEYNKLGGKGVPVILVGGQRMNGYSQGHLDKMLKTAGY